MLCYFIESTTNIGSAIIIEERMFSATKYLSFSIFTTFSIFTRDIYYIYKFEQGHKNGHLYWSTQHLPSRAYQTQARKKMFIFF